MSDGRSRIVVINDDPVQLHLVARVLEGAGYDVVEHVDSSLALEGLAAEPDVDLFVVDLHMPAIDGWKVCRLLRSPEFEAYNSTPILIVSATFMGDDVEAITADIGADGFLPMPLRREDLLAHVTDLLDGVRPATRSKVLIIEDNEDVSRAVGRTFVKHGYEAHVAGTIEDGTRLWGDLKPDLVLLDYHLPDGTGPELLSRLQSPSDRTVVLVMTGDTDPALPIRLLQLGADAYVRKPFEPAFLVELAAKARRERSLLRVEALLEHRTQELRESESRYRSLFAAIPDLVLSLDAGDRVTQANEEAVRALQPHGEVLVGTHISRFLADDSVAEVTEQLRGLRSKGEARFETSMVGADGRPLAMEITAACRDEDQGQALIVARDVSERRRAEEERRRLDAQVQHAQRLESLGVLAGGIAHDFNNLLVGVMGNASLALLDIDEGSQVYESVSQIETAARRAAELTQQILTFSGKGESVMSPQDLSSVVSEMGQLLAPAVSKKANLVYRLGRHLPRVRADASQLRQVIMNLIMNASDALGEQSGKIEVLTRTCVLDDDEVSRHTLGARAEPGTFVVIEVADEGCGMDEETQLQIFDPFFTTKFAGRGLGLAATLGIIRSHEGLVSVESTPGKGTTFRIFLPAVTTREGPRVRVDGPPSSGSWKGGGGSVLVVDDEPAVRGLATTALRRAGYRVLDAANGRSGLEQVRLDPDIGAVVLDLTMPEMDGMEALAQIRESHPGLPVLLSSGYADDALAPGTLVPGVTEFLRKPYSPRELLARIGELIAPGSVNASGARRDGPEAPAKVLRASG